MNSLQKVQVEKMRAAGIGFKEISEKINIPVSTIKSYCYKHSIKDMTAENDVRLCPQCGQPVPKMRFKPRRFCSDACRAKYWNQHPDEMKKRSVVEQHCAHCGKTFNDYAGRGRRYCSHPCYIAARYGGEQHG